MIPTAGEPGPYAGMGAWENLSALGGAPAIDSGLPARVCPDCGGMLRIGNDRMAYRAKRGRLALDEGGIMKRSVTCCFTGHRPEKLPWGSDEGDRRCIGLKARLSHVLEEAYAAGIRHYMCGMARGADFYFCEAVLALRGRRGAVTLEAVRPCEVQAALWRERARQRYFSLIEQCDCETLVQRRYDKGCMLRRNRYMVDRSSHLIAVYDGMLGGTMYTINYAKRQGLRLTILEVDKAGSE